MIPELIQIGTDTTGEAVYLQEGGRRPVLLSGNSTADRRSILCSLSESVCHAGGAVLLTDIKGSLSSLSSEVPCTLWDIHGCTGLPIRTTVTEMGPLLLAYLLELEEEQSDLLHLIFRIADENGLLLIDTKDLKALMSEVAGHLEEYEAEYGTMDRALLSSILRKIVSLEMNGSDQYLFEPAIDVRDFLPADCSGGGRAHVIDAREQEDEGRLYACYILFLLGELYENLGDREEDTTCRLTVLIDEAQMLLKDLPGSLRRRLGRILEGLSCKGVITCLSIPRNYTLPEEIAETMGQMLQIRQVDGFAQVTVTAVGACMESASNVRTAVLTPPQTSFRVLSPRERSEQCASDPLHEKYKIPFDRDSAYEFLKRRGLAESDGNGAPAAAEAVREDDTQPETDLPAQNKGSFSGTDSSDSPATAEVKSEDNGNTSSGSGDSMEQMAKRARSSAKSLGNTVAGTVGRKIGKSIGSSFGDFGETLGGNIGASLGRGIINTLFPS